MTSGLPSAHLLGIAWLYESRPLDLGYCREQPDFDVVKAVLVVRRHRKADSEGHLIRISDAMPDVRKAARDRSAQVATARRMALFGADTTDEDISRRVASGLALLAEVATRLGALG